MHFYVELSAIALLGGLNVEISINYADCRQVCIYINLDGSIQKKNRKTIRPAKDDYLAHTMRTTVERKPISVIFCVNFAKSIPSCESRQIVHTRC